MFGEHESDILRVPSPWDAFLHSPTAQDNQPQDIPKLLTYDIPKIEPENDDEGNIEYKLKLTQITRLRFDRLVTQLNWRLLEGGGRAYYELGVTDSGTLVGLSPADLQESLEMLQLMAGELGASVTVVKEIEVPPLLVALQNSGYIDPQTGEWTKKARNRHTAVELEHLATELALSTDDETALGVLAEGQEMGESEAAATTVTIAPGSPEFDEDSPPSPSSAAVTPPETVLAPSVSVYADLLSSNPSRPPDQTSPFIAPVSSSDDDSDADFFPLDDMLVGLDAFKTTTSDMDALLLSQRFSVALEITSVYKPVAKPEHRGVPSAAPIVLPLRTGKHTDKKRPQQQQQQKRLWTRRPPSDTESSEKEKEARAAQRRLARDQRREEKRKMYLAAVSASAPAPSTMQVQAQAEPEGRRATDEDVLGEHVSTTGLASVMSVAASVPALATVTFSQPAIVAPADTIVPILDSIASITSTSTASSSSSSSSSSSVSPPPYNIAPRLLERRLIVEALIVREMTMEEGYFDLGGFSL